MSFQLLLDLLYENQRYDEILKTFELIKEKQIHGTKYPKNIIVLVMATLYKMVRYSKSFGSVLIYFCLEFQRKSSLCFEVVERIARGWSFADEESDNVLRGSRIESTATGSCLGNHIERSKAKLHDRQKH